MKKDALKNSFLLLLTALIWGLAFTAQKQGMEYVEPFTYNAARSLLGGLVLLPVIPLLDRRRAGDPGWQKGSRRDILTGGLLFGLALFVASGLQQFGVALQDPATNVGKAGFITACYTIIVPVLGLFTGRRPPRVVWLGVAVAVAGFFFLCLMDGLAAGQGLGLGLSDLLLLLCALGFSVHILIIDRFSPRADGVRMSCIQFFVCGLLCTVCALVLEHPTREGITACWLPILYGGVMSSGAGYTLQIVGQRNVHPAVASLLLSMESVFAVLGGYLLMPGAGLSGWEFLGCVLVLAAVILVELAPTKPAEK